MTLKANQKGFTIIELLIATTVFSTVLLIVTYGIIQISKMYTSGFIQSQTQNNAISISNKIAQDIEFSITSSINTEQKVTITKNGSPTTYYYFCTTNNEYYYIPSGSLYQIPIADLHSSCTSPASIINNATLASETNNLLSSNGNMVILNHSLYDSSSSMISVDGNSGLYTVSLDVLYGNSSNLEYNKNTGQYNCKATVLVGPFCAIYPLTTQAYAQD